MNSPLRPLSLALAFAVGALAPVALAIPEAETAAGQAVVKRHADTIIGVEMVVVLRMNAGDRAQPPQERKVDANGTVISPTGLTVLSLGQIDPRASMSPQARANLEEPEFKEVKLRLADNTEIPAKVVLKDEDLDLAFVVPDPAAATPARTFPYADLSDAAKPEVLGTFFALTRAPKTLQRVPLVSPVTVVGVVAKPRQLVLTSISLPSCPVFDAAGKILGVSLQHIVEKRVAGYVILPAASIAEIAPRTP